MRTSNNSPSTNIIVSGKYQEIYIIWPTLFGNITEFPKITYYFKINLSNLCARNIENTYFYETEKTSTTIWH